MSHPGLNVELITRDFNRFLRDLAAIDPTLNYRTIYRDIAERVVQNALRRTRAASVAKLRQSVEGRRFTRLDGKTYYLENRYPNPLWRAIRRSLKASLDDKRARRGLSKQSWLYLGRDLNAQLAAPAYVARANANGRRYPQNAATRETGSTSAYTLTLINRSPIVQAAGGRRALLLAMRGQTRRFETLMARRFYRTASARAAAYPGIFATP
jgi:hypothetical protein